MLNVRPNVRREDAERLEAILTNCARHGPGGQNRAGHSDFEAHLRGRVVWVAALNEARGARLQAIFDRIDWSA